MTSSTVTKQILGLALTMTLLGCQGMPKEKPPIHVNPNMDKQEKALPQSANEFFADGVTMRQPVDGTVARGELRAEDDYYRGLDPVTGEKITTSPVGITAQGLKRGQERFGIYCTPCHGATGDGKGIVIKKGFAPPPSFHIDLVRNYSDGHLYDVISNGIRNMPAYADQIPVEDRWLIVNYVRALQRSQHASIDDVPESKRSQLK